MADETKVEAQAVAEVAAEAPAKVAEVVAETVETIVKESAKVAKRTRKPAVRPVKRVAATQKVATKAATRRTVRKTRKPARKAASAAKQRTQNVTKNLFNIEAIPAFAPFQSIMSQANTRGQDMVKRSQKVAEELADLARANVEAVVEASRVAAEGARSIGQDVAATSRSGGLLQRSVDASGNKTKLGASRHGQRRSRMIRQHENRCVVGRLVSPPALPAVVRPRASDGTKHVAPENPGTDSLKALLDGPVVNAGLAAVLALHALP